MRHGIWIAGGLGEPQLSSSELVPMEETEQAMQESGFRYEHIDINR